MDRSVVIAALAIALSGCATWQDESRQCFATEPLFSPTSASELKAARFVKRELASDCRSSGLECNLKLHREPNGNIAITASRAIVSESPLVCTRLEGGFETYVFSPDGRFVEIVLGL